MGAILMITWNTRDISIIVDRSRTGRRLCPLQRGWFKSHFFYGDTCSTATILSEYRAYAAHCATNSYKEY